MRRFVTSAALAINALVLIASNDATATQTYTNPYDSYTVTVPDAPWEVEPTDRTRQVAIIRNFPVSKYGPQGSIPQDGAEIRIVPMPVETEERAHLAYMSRFGRDVKWSTSEPLKVHYLETWPVDGSSLTTAVTVIRREGTVLKFIVTCHTDDPDSETYEDVFDGIVDSLKVPKVARNVAAPPSIVIHGKRITQTADGYAFSYPDSWHIISPRDETPTSGDGIVISSVPSSSYAHGGSLPEFDGAHEISVVLLSGKPDPDTLLRERAGVGATDLVRTSPVIDGHRTERLDYKSLGLWSMATLCVTVDDKFFVITLTHATTDPIPPAAEAALDQVISTIGLGGL